MATTDSAEIAAALELLASRLRQNAVRIISFEFNSDTQTEVEDRDLDARFVTVKPIGRTASLNVSWSEVIPEGVTNSAKSKVNSELDVNQAQNGVSEFPQELAVFGDSNPAVQAFRMMKWPVTPGLLKSWIQLAKRCEKDAILLPEKDRLDARKIVEILLVAAPPGAPLLQFSILPAGETETGPRFWQFERETLLRN